MRYYPGILLLAAVLTACAREPLLPGIPRNITETGGKGRNGQQPGSEDTPPGEHIYLTSVRFPDGYDWELDTCAVEGTVWIDLYRDGKRFRSIPAGASVHPDMHRFTRGHLYTDYSTAEETVLCRDGTELFRFDGREALRGFLVREDGVHTLGQDRDGSGFTYRVDGREVYRSETGSVLGALDRSGPAGGALTQEGEDIFFRCLLPKGQGWERRLLQNGECIHAFDQDGDIGEFALLEGKVCRVRDVARRTVLETDGAAVPLGITGSEHVLWSRLLTWDGEAAALLCASGLRGKRCFLTTETGRTLNLTVGKTVSEALSEGKRLVWTITGDDGLLEQVCREDGNNLLPGPGAYLASGRCLLLHDGHVLLAVTGREGASNRFLQDEETEEIPFNGYFTSVVVE